MEDQAQIRRMVWKAHLNPTGLNWKRFMVAENPDGLVTGCAQIKIHLDGSKELASLVVDPKYQGKGIARLIVEHLIQDQAQDLFLMCQDSMGDFYRQFGFEIIGKQEMSPFFRRINRFASLFQIFNSGNVGLLVMKKQYTTPG
jgi:N-acetylglutamate synthase-like GNAT family acetyltransferase